MESQQYDLDKLAFYVKVLEFKAAEPSQSTLAAGLILDNYISDEAEYCIGNYLGDTIIKNVENKFEHALANPNQSGMTVAPKDLFDECLKLLSPELEPLVKEFMNI